MPGQYMPAETIINSAPRRHSGVPRSTSCFVVMTWCSIRIYSSFMPCCTTDMPRAKRCRRGLAAQRSRSATRRRGCAVTKSAAVMGGQRPPRRCRTPCSRFRSGGTVRLDPARRRLCRMALPLQHLLTLEHTCHTRRHSRSTNNRHDTVICSRSTSSSSSSSSSGIATSCCSG